MSEVFAATAFVALGAVAYLALDLVHALLRARR